MTNDSRVLGKGRRKLTMVCRGISHRRRVAGSDDVRPLSGARRLRWLLAATLGLAAASPAPAQVTDQDRYAQGLELLEIGDWLGALRLWDAGRETLGGTNRSDPRIGVAYIETALAHRAIRNYEAACEMYFWGFSGDNLHEHAEAVEAEVERIFPLLLPPDLAVWRSDLEQGVDVVAERLRQYWVDRDPTPLTALNERLLEHWQRITYARENYRQNESTVYGTDDRGLIYVKYGEPGMTKSGFLGATEVDLRAWVVDPFVRDALRRLDTNPAYEVWVYDSLRPEQLTYFLFGNVRGTGRFALVDGVEELINQEAWSPATRRYMPGGVKAFYYLQLFYYGDVSAVGGPFQTRAEELNVLWGQAQGRAASFGSGSIAPRESSLEAYDLRYKQDNKTSAAFKPVLAARTEYAARERTVELIPWHVRILSRENEPQLVLIALSSPRQQVVSLSEEGDPLDVPEQQVRHTLIIQDGAYEEIGRVDNWVPGDEQGVSTFTVRHLGTTLHYTLVAEAFDVSPGASPDAEPTAVARTVVADPEPLTMLRDSLELSDVVTGIEVPEGYAESTFPFPLLPSWKIWKPDPVKVYLEVYHLALNEDGTARFSTDLQVTPVGTLGEAESEQAITLSLDFESETDRKAVAVDIANVPAGAFHLRVTVTDMISGQSKSRVVPLQVVQLTP
jgi:GWxTD domain-containing protein